MKKISKEEKEILESYEKGEKAIPQASRTELKRFVGYAKQTLAKNKRINIRLAEGTLAALQMRAVEEGIPYQTLISSILHKFITGKLAERQL